MCHSIDDVMYTIVVMSIVHSIVEQDAQIGTKIDMQLQHFIKILFRIKLITFHPKISLFLYTGHIVYK